MSIAPDLDNLVVIGKYFSRVKDASTLKNQILMALYEADKSWMIESDLKRWITFVIDIFKKTGEKAKKAKTENQRILLALMSIKSSVPSWLRVLVSEITEKGCVLEISTQTILYHRITQIVGYLKKYPPTIFEIKSSIYESREFIRQIFIGALECEELDPPHPLKPVEESSCEILFNTKDTKELTKKILSALNNANKEVYVAGWIGCYIIPALKKLHKNKIKVKILTKTPSKTTKGYRDKEEALNELKSFIGKDDLRFLKTGHFRLLIVDDNSIFDGSMDMDSESLAEREESAIWTNDPYLVAKGKIKFDELFKKGKFPSGWK